MSDSIPNVIFADTLPLGGLKQSWRCTSCNKQFAMNAHHVIEECARAIGRSLIEAKERIMALELENAELKAELNRLAIVYGAGVGQIVENYHPSRDDFANHDSGTM